MRIVPLIAAAIASTTAFGHLIVSPTPTFDTGTGFGTVPNVLTLQPGGNVTLESGCITPNGAAPGGTLNSCGAFTVGAPAGGYTGMDGTGPIPNKSSSPTLGSLGITSYSDLQIVFNAIEPGNANTSITIQNLTLAIFAAGNLTTPVAQFELLSPVTLDTTLQGSGKSGFPITIDPTQAAAAAASFNSTNRIGLAARLGCVGTPSSTNACSDAGPDTFIVSSISNPGGGGGGDVIPEPSTWTLLAGGGALLALVRARFRRIVR